MIKEDSIRVNTEILGILNSLGIKYISKLPNQLINYIINNCDKDNIPLVDLNKPLEDQNISKDARIFLTILKLKYWCESDEEKSKLLKLLEENEKKNISNTNKN